jgi:hypothetical protein
MLVQIKKHLLNSWQESSAVKLDFVVFGQGFQGKAEMNQWEIRHRSIITSVFLKSTSSTLAPFFASMLLILPSR